jgi:hypothetical protein
MAYDFIPQKVSEILEHKKIKDYAALEMSELYSFLKSKDKNIDDPLAIDVQKSAVKILPSFEKKVNLSIIKTKLKLKVIKVAFGRGSRGIANKSSGTMKSGKMEEGSSNKGIIFEKELTKALNDHFRGETLTTQKYKKPFIDCIDEIQKIYELKNKDVQVIPEGALNKRRPVTFVGESIYIGGPNFNIGATVTDITLKAQDDRKRTDHVYLSLKYGPKVTFFNAGVGRILPKADLEKGIVENIQGKAILELFGISVPVFTSVFDPKAKKLTVNTVDTFKDIDRNKLKNLIKSGMGYGYLLVHQSSNGQIHNVEMTQSKLEQASTPQSCVVIYGGASGTAKRVDILVETPMFKLIFNFRNKARGGVYPSHLMCDYTIKH